MSKATDLAAAAAAYQPHPVTVLPPGVRIHRGTDPVTGQPCHFRWQGITERRAPKKQITFAEVLKNLGK